MAKRCVKIIHLKDDMFNKNCFAFLLQVARTERDDALTA